MWSLCLFVVLPIILVQCSATILKQERATVRRCNIKYVEKCYSITRRLRRGEPYKTNLTTVTRYQWDNNVTYKLVLLNSGFPVEVVRVKLCDLQNITWLSQYFRVYSNLVGKCPHKPYKLVLLNSGFPVEVVRVKLCDLQNITWLSQYFRIYSNLVGKCPHKPGTYGLYNMELPPKDLPQAILNLVKSKTHVSFLIVVTATEEIIVEYSVTVS